MKGLEPPRLAASDPKSDAAANYATPAKIPAANLRRFFQVCKFFRQKIFRPKKINVFFIKNILCVKKFFLTLHPNY